MIKELDPDYINVDPLEQTYHESIIEVPERVEALKAHNTALLCIDMQYLDAAPGHGVFADATNNDVPVEAQEYYFSVLKNTVFPNVRKLQDCFRSNGLEVIHVRIQSLTQDGRDRSTGHKMLNLLATPGSKEAEFIEEVAPVGDEIVMNKTSSGVFTSTNLFYVLKNLDIDSLFVTGVYTNECVSTTVRDACDLGFLVTTIEDGCASVTHELHDFTIATLKARYTRVMTANEAIEEIQRHCQPNRRTVKPS
ncbi:isochorismatase family protein [candidate division GN15 bacterium]|nr:isochorismatase family protein [candidate division GN15 bacterium]